MPDQPPQPVPVDLETAPALPPHVGTDSPADPLFIILARVTDQVDRGLPASDLQPDLDSCCHLLNARITRSESTAPRLSEQPVYMIATSSDRRSLMRVQYVLSTRWKTVMVSALLAVITFTVWGLWGIPVAIFAIISSWAILAMVATFERRFRVLQINSCPNCRYDLAGSPPGIPPQLLHDLHIGPRHCPECGRPWPLIPPASARG